MPLRAIRDFFKYEAAAGILLGLTALLALALKNSPLDFLYDTFLKTPVVLSIGEFIINKPLLLWVNDGLMAVFFLLVGLEIKREILEGQLSSKDQISLPAIAALGGLTVPALVYSYINWGDTTALHGWAIPAATDIAFALGVISLLGKRVPYQLKLCLVAIAILDDLVAIVIIALFYTDNLSLYSLMIGAIALLALFALNKREVKSLTPYIICGIFLWACVLKSGVHATLAGVVLAFFIPLNIKYAPEEKPLRQLEHTLHPYVAYFILPLFAFANAGVSFSGLSFSMFLEPVTLGIILGLFLGKQIGVMLFTKLGVMMGLCKLPRDVNWSQFYGMALITGIGFTMSLFIGTLAFDVVEKERAVRLGVLIGSVLSGVIGYLFLAYACQENEETI